MEEKVYRQRRNLMITCIGIILFYMGPGDFNEIGLLKNLGLHTLEAWQLKAMILVMYLYYAWRYRQYCIEYPGEVTAEFQSYLTERFRDDIEIIILERAKEKFAQAQASGLFKDRKLEEYIFEPQMTSPLSDWVFCFPTSSTNVYTSALEGFDNSPIPKRQPKNDFVYRAPALSMPKIKIKALTYILVNRKGFTDWIMPWLFFWGTWFTITWNEVIKPLLGGLTIWIN